MRQLIGCLGVIGLMIFYVLAIRAAHKEGRL